MPLRLARRLFCLAAAAALAMPALAADIETPSGTFRFDPPPGYTELSAQEIDAKFGRNGRKPIKAFGNASRASTVSVMIDSASRAPLSTSVQRATMRSTSAGS